MMKAWETHFDDRQHKEIDYCILYAKDYAHGTDGHNMRLIIAKMAELLDMGVVPYIAPEPQAGPRQPIRPNKPEGGA